MKRTITLALLLLAPACQRSADEGASKTTAASEPARGSTPAPDNTGKNERDRNAGALTSGDQGGSDADRTVTQRIRQGVTQNDGLSVNAQNVKIVTQDGVVTLRGPVKTKEEKTQIAAIAQSVDGVKRVDNQLEVATN